MNTKTLSQVDIDKLQSWAVTWRLTIHKLMKQGREDDADNIRSAFLLPVEAEIDKRIGPVPDSHNGKFEACVADLERTWASIRARCLPGLENATWNRQDSARIVRANLYKHARPGVLDYYYNLCQGTQLALATQTIMHMM